MHVDPTLSYMFHYIKLIAVYRRYRFDLDTNRFMNGESSINVDIDDIFYDLFDQRILALNTADLAQISIQYVRGYDHLLEWDRRQVNHITVSDISVLRKNASAVVII